ncbi:MAG TPA: glutathione S-transferase N-terminal domain-containing protein [Polyangiaceae bacterium]|nr:glutathione S-transferase N-terminal domain-containing protein [Polyangiaceae bacterium]
MAELELFIVDKNDTSWSMRPWLLLAHHGIPFTETSFVYADAGTPARIRAISPTGRVPVLRVGSRFVWESLAVVETLAELHPEQALWPRDAGLRMHARSIASEMHAGFAELRRHCPMNLALGTRVELDPARRAEFARFEKMVETARAEATDAGPFLFGAFSAADAMLAPVATRIVSYGLDVGAVTRGWVDAVYALPAFQRWEREAAAERALRPVSIHNGVRFDGSVHERVVAGPSYAVIFTSQRTNDASDYGATAERMEALAASTPGYQSHVSARGADGLGVTVSYWDSLENIAGFRARLEHAEAQRAGRARYYAHYDLRVARVQKHVTFDAARSPARVESW